MRASSSSGKAGSLYDGVGIVLGSLLIAWPAIYSGFPLLYPDSAEYIHAGRPTAAAILLGHRSSYYGMRSLIYSLGILPFHPGGLLWPVIGLQCALTSWVLWLVFRSVLPGANSVRFASLIAILSIFTSLSWFGSFVMPDILGPDLYLCTYLLVFARASLSTVERVLLLVVSWWAIASHATHLPIGIAVCGALALLAIVGRRKFRDYRKNAALVGAVFLLAIAAQLAVNARLYGNLSLTGNRPPFLTARILEDGPGRLFLAKHCPEGGWELCRYKNNLAGTSNHFLWDSDGVWKQASAASRISISQQEGPFVKAVLLEYPGEQLRASAHNFVAQLKLINLQDFAPNPDIVLGVRGVLTRAGGYLTSRQSQGQLHLRFFYEVHKTVVLASLAGILLLLPWLNRRRPRRLIALGTVVATGVVANALVTGTLSMVCGRYESRVMWMVPMFACLCCASWLRERQLANSAEMNTPQRA